MVLTGNVPPQPVYVVAKSFAQLIARRFTDKDGLPSGSIEGIECHGGRVIARSRGGAFVYHDGAWQETQQKDEAGAPSVSPTGPNGERILSQARARDGRRWVVTLSGAYREGDGGWQRIEIPRRYVAHQVMPDIDLTARCVVGDQSGHVWLGTDRGAYLTDGADWWHPIDHRDGMPYVVLNCLHLTANGDLWGGTPQGAWRLRNGRFRYFWGKRWLPGNFVNAIASDESGRVWLATDGGVALIEEKRTTFAEKAAHYEEITQKRHSRNGWIAGCSLAVPGYPEKGHVHHASDNDGLWTAIYVAAESFRYAVERSAEARQAARKSLDALLDLVRLSGYPGFPARAIIRKGEHVTGYDSNETVRVPGELDKIWYTSPTHPNVLCKGDTSSDELDGHYFAWYVYHELVADDAEKAEIADVCRAVTDNLLQHEYTLVGHTGRKTRWGVFAPQYLNEDPRWVEERGLNSLELLCYLKVAHHICGDQRYAQAYEDLIARHHYLQNTLLYRRDTPWYAVNFSDDELAYCVYYPLLRLEQRPERRLVLLESIATTWRGLKQENRAWYNIEYAALTGEPGNIEAAVECLQDWPWELVNWRVENSHRHDVELKHIPWRRGPLLTRVLPFSELPVMRWNGNPFEPDGGGDGSSEEDGGAWLLAYWMGRYHGIIRH